MNYNGPVRSLARSLGLPSLELNARATYPELERETGRGASTPREGHTYAPAPAPAPAPAAAAFV